jgi:hypothetical protein
VGVMVEGVAEAVEDGPVQELLTQEGPPLLRLLVLRIGIHPRGRNGEKEVCELLGGPGMLAVEFAEEIGIHGSGRAHGGQGVVVKVPWRRGSRGRRVAWSPLRLRGEGLGIGHGRDRVDPRILDGGCGSHWGALSEKK